MDHFQKIREKLTEQGLDAMMLTNEANRLYATGFHSTDTDGLALVTRSNTYYFTDSRYTEAAERVIRDAILREVKAGRGYTTLVEEVIREENLQKIGFEDAYMTVQDYERYRKTLSCELVPATDLMLQLPIMSDWTYQRLRVSPCRYSGTLRGEDLVLLAHSYNAHFGRLSTLTEGAEIQFTDMDGKIWRYEVVLMDILNPTDVEEMTAGEYDLTLFSCTKTGKQRVTVRCNLIR